MKPYTVEFQPLTETQIRPRCSGSFAHCGQLAVYLCTTTNPRGRRTTFYRCEHHAQGVARRYGVTLPRPEVKAGGAV